VIVRIMGEGQWRVEDAFAGRLAELDAETEQAAERGDEAELHATLAALAELVRSGEKLDDAHLEGSDAIVPPLDLTIEEARAIIDRGELVPDLP
jgi:hypothetical protein